MSQQPRSTAQGSSASENTSKTQQNVSSAHDGGATAAPRSRLSPSSSTQHARAVESSSDFSRAPASMLPPLQRTTGVDDSTLDRRASRSLGVHAILNNPASEAGEPRGVRRSASEMEDRSGEVRQATLPPLGLSRPPSVDSPLLETTSPGNTMRGPPRRILTPRSPTLRSVASLGRLSGSTDSRTSPYLSPRSRTYTIEPGAGNAPPLPTPPAGARASYGFPAPSMSTPPLHPRRMSLERETSRTGAVSPGASYRSLQQSRPLTPRDSYGGEPTVASQMYQHTANTMYQSAPPSTGQAASPQYVPISSGTGNYQILTMPTHKGPVQIPVDVQAASKMADEKRKRNAGASARFRERRKLKEKEAATTIHRLEVQLRDATEDAEFYHRERDSLAQLLFQSPGGDRHFPRPQSPRRNRVPGTPGSSVGGSDTASGSRSGGYAISESSEMPRRGPETTGGERNTRRRTTGPYSLPPPQPASAMPPASTAFGSTYTPITPAPSAGQQQPFQPASHHYTSVSGTSSEAHASNMNPQLAPRPPLGPPHPPEHERSWPPASHGGRGGPSSFR